MKKYIALIILAFLLLSATTFAESEDITVVIPEFDVRVNNELIDTKHSQYPVITYNDITYFPMTFDYLNGIGLNLSFSSEEGLKISVKDVNGTLKQSFLGVNNVLGSLKTAQFAIFPIEVNGKVIDNDNEEYPIILYKDITYFPMTWRFVVDEFGWKTTWSDKTGLTIIVDDSVITSIPEKERRILTSTEIGELAESVVKLEIALIDNSSATGSGFYYNDSGGIITNFHVIEGASFIRIIDNDGVIYEGDIIIKGYSEEDDLAVLDTDIANDSFIEFGDSDNVKLGNEIYAIGSPLGLINTLSDGIVSAIRPEGIQISAAISIGSSGGVLLNNYGEAIGVTYSGYIEGENLGLAIPINKVKMLEKNQELTLNELNGESVLYYDTIEFDNGDVYIGGILNNEFHGQGEYHWINGNYYIGNWVNSLRSGNGAMRWNDGAHYSGNWVDDNIHGIGTYTYPNGDKYIGNFDNYDREGYGEYYWSDGDVFEGYWSNNLRNGDGKYIYADGSVIYGTWIDGEYVELN